MPNKALVIIDLQRGIGTLENPLFEINKVLMGVNDRIKEYRDNNDFIIFIQHTDADLPLGSKEWSLFPELDTRSEDLYVTKTHANSFYKTELSNILNKFEIKELEFCGAQSEYCVDTTIRFAHGLGYKCYMKKALSTTINGSILNAKDTIKYHENIWNKRFLEFI